MEKLNIDDVENNLMVATKLSNEQRKKLVRWLNRQNILIIIEVFKEQRNQYFRLKSTIKDETITSISSFYLAIYKFYTIEQDFRKKHKSNSIEKIAKYSNFIIKQSQKPSKKPKLEKLRNMWSVIEKYKKNGESFRKISINLQIYYKFEVTHSYIQQEWARLNNNE